MGDETDDDLDTSSDPEMFYLDSEDEPEDSSGNESGYFTPPLTPAAAPAEELLGEDFMTEDKNEPTMTASESPPVVESNTALEDELVSSTVKETPSELTPEKKEAEFDSDEDQALIDCVNLDREAEGIFNRVGNSTSVYVTTSMWSYIINYPLSRMLKNMRIAEDLRR